jgi:hypothetical protein
MGDFFANERRRSLAAQNMPHLAARLFASAALGQRGKMSI